MSTVRKIGKIIKLCNRSEYLASEEMHVEYPGREHNDWVNIDTVADGRANTGK